MRSGSCVVPSIPSFLSGALLYHRIFLQAWNCRLLNSDFDPKCLMVGIDRITSIISYCGLVINAFGRATNSCYEGRVGSRQVSYDQEVHKTQEHGRYIYGQRLLFSLSQNIPIQLSPTLQTCRFVLHVLSYYAHCMRLRMSTDYYMCFTRTALSFCIGFLCAQCSYSHAPGIGLLSCSMHVLIMAYMSLEFGRDWATTTSFWFINFFCTLCCRLYRKGFDPK